MGIFTVFLLFVVATVTAIPDFQYDLEKAEEHFQTFIEKYGKRYSNKAEKTKRFEAFKDSLKRYNKKNLEQVNAKFAYHEQSDLTVEELKAVRSCYRRRVNDNDGCTKRGAPAVNAPAAYDWQVQGGVVTSVKKQQCGDCWAFSTTANVESQYAKKYGKLVDLSEQQLVDCVKNCNGCRGGDLVEALIGLKKVGGLMSLANYPYAGKDGNCAFDPKKIQAKVKSCEYYNFTSEDDLVKVLYNRGPLAVAIDAQDLEGYHSGILKNCAKDDINHGVVLVGYGVENNVKFWRFKNSWGLAFGEEGYFRVERGTDNCGLLDFEVTSAIIA